MDLEKLIEYNNLFEVYSFSLSLEQQSVLKDFVHNNLGVSEIAENKGISRQAVSKIIKSSIKKLEFLESNLHFLKIMSKLKSELSEIDQNLTPENIQKAKTQIQKIIKEL